jgi:hypothetical protein
MSRISNLTTIRNKLNNTWQSEWFDNNYYNILLFEDLKTRFYLFGIFKRLEIPTSYFYLQRDNSLNFFINGDLFLLDRNNVSNLRRVFIEIEKFNYFLFLSFYTINSYFFFKLKQSGIKFKINLGFNSDSNLLTSLKKNDTILKNHDFSKHFIYSLYFQKKNRYFCLNKFNVLFSSYLNTYRENFLDISDKYLTNYYLNIDREDDYNFIKEWTSGWFYNKNDNYYNLSNKLFFFFFSLISNANYLFFFDFFDNYIYNNISFYVNNFYFFFVYNKQKKNLNYFNNSEKKLNKSLDLFMFDKNFILMNIKQLNKFFFMKCIYYLFFKIKLFIFFFYLFNNVQLLNIFYFIEFFKLLKYKIVLYFNNLKNSTDLFMDKSLGFLKRLFYNHKKFLKRVTDFNNLKYKFINRTYYKQYFKHFFYYFIKEMENTVHYYLSKKTSYIYNICFIFNVFFKFENLYPPIKDAKIINDYISIRLNKFLSINRIFYEIRDWQFKNYYNRKYILNNKNNDYYFYYGEKKYPILGMRIECSGSYKAGSRKSKKYYGEIAKEVELVNKNPNNSFFADIDYFQSVSKLKSGSIGIKVWVFFKTHLYNKNKHFISIVTSD